MVLSTSTTSKCVEVQMEGVPIRRIIDTGSDITILSGSAFQEIATISNLKRNSLNQLIGKLAPMHGHHPLNLDGQIDLHIKFGEKCICETVYVKLDAPDTLLLSENVCCKLQIVSYHPDVQPVLDHEPSQRKSKRPSKWKSKRKRKSKKAKIKLIQTISLPADSSDKQRKKSSQQSKEADNLLPTTGNQGGEQPRSPYNLRHQQRGLTRNINSRSSLVSEGICNSSGISHLISQLQSPHQLTYVHNL